MSYKRALVAYDGSEHSKNALDVALEMVGSTFIRDLVVLYVSEAEVDHLIEPAALTTGLPIIMMTEADRDILAAEVMEHARGFEEAVELIVVVGIPKNDIIRISDEKKCDIIVMGSRGLGAIRSILGSVSYSVIRDAEVPVLIVK